MVAASLGIDVEDWSLELVPEIERSFGVVLSDADWHRIATLGDLHAAVLQHGGPMRGNACGTARTFYMLRRTLARDCAIDRIGVDWCLAEIGLSPNKLQALLGLWTELRLPVPGLSWRAGMGCLAAVMLAAAGLWFDAWWMLLPSMAVGDLGLVSDRGSWVGDWATLGNLARSTAALNHALLVDQGAIHSPATVWHALTNLLAAYGPPVGEVQPTTVYLLRCVHQSADHRTLNSGAGKGRVSRRTGSA